MKVLGEIALKTVPRDGLIQIKLESVEQWGRDILEELRKLGYYVNKAKGDPAGRW